MFAPCSSFRYRCPGPSRQRLAQRKARVVAQRPTLNHLKIPPQFRLREHGGSICAQQRIRQKAAGFCRNFQPATPAQKQTEARKGEDLRQKVSFLLAVNGRFLFDASKRKWGFNSLRRMRRICPPLRHYDSRPLCGRQSCRFLETGSLHPPLAALRLFPRGSLPQKPPRTCRVPLTYTVPR